MIHRTVEVQFQFEAEELAREFSEMTNDQQAVFFSELARISDQWNSPFVFQLQAISTSEKLTDAGRRVMSEIGEYAEAAESCEGE